MQNISGMLLAEIPKLEWIDWTVIGIFFAIVLGIGAFASMTAGKNTKEFFLGGRSMPWWLLGVSMVACTFSCDTPNLVAGFVRENGVSKNWAWWSFLITGMVTVFIYAQLWRRSKVMTDLEFYELRYGGKGAAFLRGFRSIYLGFFFNALIMGSVTLAAIKIGAVILGVDPWVTVVCASIFVVIYASIGGIKGVIWADFFQYTIAMGGAIYAAYVACGEAGGLDKILANEAVRAKMSVMPDFSNWLSLVPLLIVPVAIQWWSVWYPGAEPGGGGCIAQRMLSAKDEKNAIGATLFFNFCHYAMRPWPWIIVALASIYPYPDLASIKKAFPSIDPTYIKHDIAYPVMISKLGSGFLGLVVASLIAAYMSTIGTHLNWGSSYAVNDFYRRFVRPQASEKELVSVGRVCTVLLMVFAGTLSLTVLNSATQAFDLMLLSGAGTGLVYLLRWFWWRINAATEITAMVVATVAACVLVFGVEADQVSNGLINIVVDRDMVANRTFVINDKDTMNTVLEGRKYLKNNDKKFEEAIEKEVDLWKAAKKKFGVESEEFKAAAKSLNDKMDEIGNIKKANSFTKLILQSKNPAVIKEFNDFRKRIFEKQVKQANESIEKQNKQIAEENKELPKDKQKKLLPMSDYTKFGLDGSFKNGTLYVFHTDVNELAFPLKLLIMIVVVTISWLVVTLITKPENSATLRNFYLRCHPGGPGWRKVAKDAKAEGIEIDPKGMVDGWKMPIQILCVFFGCVSIYCSLFSVGAFVYGDMQKGFILGAIAVVAIIILFKLFNKLGTEADLEKEIEQGE